MPTYPAPFHFTALTCFVLLFLLSPVSAVAEPSVHALQSVMVKARTSTNLEQPEKPHHLLDQVFNSRCQVLPGRNEPATFLAGTVAGPLELAVRAMTCPVPDTPPTLTCDWDITPSMKLNEPSCNTVGDIFLDGQQSWKGEDGTLALTLPNRTGIYDLTMTCVIHSAGKIHTERVNYPLYVTYAKPLSVLGPPSEAMYEKASCWGAGFTAEDSEEKVLKGLLDGLHRFGQRYWRYGYARQVADVPYLFHGRNGTYPVFGNPLKCGHGGRCKCYWEDLAAGVRCDFGDCFTFADLFQGISATAGILTLSQCDTCIFGGTHKYGFLITPDPPSFDADFPRDVICDDQATCPTTYYFGKHNLVVKPPLYYDPTFDNIYKNPANAVDSVVKYLAKPLENGRKLYTLSTATTTVQQLLPSYYGAWSFYRYLRDTPRQTEEMAMLPTRAINFQRSRFVTVPGPERQDLNSALAVEIEIKPDTAGRYALYGTLFKGAEPITRRPDWWTAGDTVTIFEADAGEVIKTRLEFSGEDIYRSQKSGPYTVRPYVLDQDGIAHTMTPARTKVYSHKQFAESAASLQAVTHRWLTARDGGPPRLQVDVTLQVRIPKQLTVQLELSQGGRAVAFAATDCGEPCQATTRALDGYAVSLTLKAPLATSPKTSESKSPYMLTVGLFESTPRLRNLDGWYDANLPAPQTTTTEDSSN